MRRAGPSTQPRAMENHERLLRAAREVLAERGLQASIQEVITRAGIGAGTVYRNYPDKESLFLEVAREMANRTNAELLAIAANVPDARECVAQVMKVGFKRVEEYGQLAIEMFAGNVPPAYRAVAEHETLCNFFARMIRRGISQGRFRPDLDVEYAVAVWFALVAPQALRLELARRSVADIAALTTEFFLSAISVRSAGPNGPES